MLRHIPGLSLPLIFCGVLTLAACSDSEPKKSESEEHACVEPENPYQEGTGHYAGYEWAERTGGDCNGNSTSFNEGCEEYHSQEDKYEECEAKEK